MSHYQPPERFSGKPGADPGDEVFLEIAPEVEMVFCWCPKPDAPFRMGSPESEAERDSDETPHWVMLSRGFWLAKQLCTQAQYAGVMERKPARRTEQEDIPVALVSWEDATAFCNRVNGRQELPGGWRLALPTEAQWEYACRAGRSFEFPFGVGEGRRLHAQLANFDGNHPYETDLTWQDRNATIPVGAFPPNAWGLHDMHGQLYEWCEDWFGEYAETTETAPLVDPTGAEKGTYRVLRGGYWIDFGRDCRAAYRFHRDPGYRYDSIGFRLALVPPGQSGPEAGSQGAERRQRRAGVRDERRPR